MELMRGLAFVALLFAGSAVGAELRQAEVCGDGTTHQLGFCPAVLSSASCSATGATTGSCSATSDESDGTRYVCATSNNTALTGAEIEACSGGAAIAGSSAAETGSNSVSLSGLTTDAAHYGQIVNESPEGWYSNRLVPSSFTPTEPGGDPYDLSSHSIQFTHTWPTEPTTSSTVNVTANSCSSLQSAISSGARVVNVPAGTYSSCSLTLSQSDLDIVMSNSATLNGSLSITGDRIRWTGGSITSTAAIGIDINGADDLLFDNVNISCTPSGGNECVAYRGANNRSAWINVTAEVNGGNSWLFHSRSTAAGGSNYSPYDVTFANVRLNNNSTGAAMRLNPVTRLVVVDSLVNDGSENTGIRFSASEDVYLGNIIQAGQFHTNCASTCAGYIYTWDIDGFLAVNIDHYFILGAFFYSDSVVRNSDNGSISGSTLHTTAGAGTPGYGFASDGGGNARVSWDGNVSSIIFDNMAGKTSAASYGADH